MKDSVVKFAPPLIGEEEIAEICDTLRSDWLTTGPKTKLFEEEFAKAVEAPAALAVNSCTAALHLSLVAHEVGPGDEVITTPLTFASTANVIEHVGARPVLVDVEPDTLTIDPQKVSEAVTTRTRAIIPVHYAGHPADMEAIRSVADKHDLLVLEDAAHALPAKHSGRTIGSMDNPTAFSFYATKNLTTGEGGMLTGATDWIENVRLLSLHGLSRDAWKRYDSAGKWLYDIVKPGFKYNMTDLQASLGLCQLKKLGMFQQRRREIVAAYNQAFANHEAFLTPVVRGNCESSWHLYVLRLRNERISIDRDFFIDQLRSRGICTSVHFIPIHIHSYYRNKYGFCPADFENAYSNYCRMMSLPLSPALDDSQVGRVIDAVLDVAFEYRRRAA